MSAAVPMAVLVRALAALQAANEGLNNPAAPDPYMLVLKSKIELGHYVEKMLAAPIEVTTGGAT